MTSEREDCRDSDHGSHRRQFDRRGFLSAAALGVAGTALQPGQALAGLTGTPEAETADPNSVYAFEGALLGIDAGGVHVQVGQELRSVPAGRGLTISKGSDVSASAAAPGDSALVRVRNGQVERIWLDLATVRGVVTGRTARGYVIHSAARTQDAARDLELIIDPGARFDEAYSGQRTSPVDLPADTALDLVGLYLDGATVRGTYLSYALPGSKPIQSGPVGPTSVTRSEIQTVDGPLAVCTYTYTGTATLYDCCTNCGRCATCDTGRSDQTAWPSFDSSCHCCGDCSCCNCSAGCKNQTNAWCGKAISITNLCNGQGRVVYVADCGPCATSQNCGCCSPNVCGYACTKCSTYYTPIVDLTRPTFAAFYDPTTTKCFAVQAQNTINC